MSTRDKKEFGVGLKTRNSQKNEVEIEKKIIETK